jgi:hypothetical protein
VAYAGIGRFLLKEAPLILSGAYAAYGALEVKNAPDPFQGRRCQVVIARPSPEDVVVNTFDFVNITSGAVDTSWTAGDFTGVEARLRTFYAAIAARIPSDCSLREFRWNVLPNPPGVINPAVRVAPPATALAFSGTARLPAQLAVAITKTTAVRKHWGRIYIGPLSDTSFVGSSGRVSTATADLLGGAFETLRAGLQADDTPMIVYNRTENIYLSVDGSRTDDVFDVVRSRRLRAASYRKITP